MNKFFFRYSSLLSILIDFLLKNQKRYIFCYLILHYSVRVSGTVCCLVARDNILYARVLLVLFAVLLLTNKNRKVRLENI